MRHFSLLSALMILVGISTLTGCTDDNNQTLTPPDAVTPRLLLSTQNVEAEAVGGTYTVGYAIENGYDDISIQVTCDAQWVTNITTEGSTIAFDVATNPDPAPRSAQLMIKYPGIESVSVAIIQKANDKFFEMAISNETSTSCQSTVLPRDMEMPYIVYLAEVDYFAAAGITTAEELFADDYNYFTSLAKEYDSNLGQFMMINQISFIGQSDISWTGMTPNKEYVLYAYGIEFNNDMTDYTMATPVSYMMVTLESGALRTIEFDVTVTVDGPEVFYEFEPINWDGKYYIDIHAEGDYFYVPEGESPSADYSQMVVDSWLAMMNQYMMSGYSGEQLMNIMCLQGPDSYSEMRDADRRYMMSFYAIDLVDGIPQVVSHPYLVHFKTEPVSVSDMTFEVDMSNVYTRVADIRITPSANDPYTIALVLSDQVPEGSNEDIINWAIDSFYLSLFEGEVVSHVNTLDPETDYSLLIFGYYGGVITTDLTRIDFTTDPESECENSVVRVDFLGPYSPMELASHFPNILNGMEAMYEQYGFYVMWAEIITEKPSQDVFFYHYDESEMALGDGYIFNDLIMYPSTQIATLTARSGVEFTMCGITMDYRGNYSEMWKSEPFMYEYNEETKRPIEEFIERFNTPNTAGKMMLVVPGERTAKEQTISVMKK